MILGGPMVLPALLIFASTAQVGVGGRFETRVGQAPTGLALDPNGVAIPAEQGQVLLIATPILSLQYLSDLDDLRAMSSTRILWRPEPLPHDRPLVLQSVDLTEAGILGKRSRWRLSLRGTYGEEDYTSLSQQFASQPTLPRALTVLMAEGNGEVAWRAARRTDLLLQFLALHRRSLDDQTAPGTSGGNTAVGFALPPQTTASVTPGIRHRLTRDTTVEALATVMDTDVGRTTQGALQLGELNVLSLQPLLGLRQRLGRNHQLHAAAGLAYAISLRRPDQAPSFPPVLPLAQIDLTSVLHRSHDMQWRSTLGAATNAFVDPVLGTEVLRATGQARLDLDLGTYWGLGALGIFATDITGPLPTLGGPGVADAAALAPDETLVSAEISARYRRAERLLLELGARFTQRAPHLESPSFAWLSNKREVWLFFSATLSPRFAQHAPVPVGPPSRRQPPTRIDPNDLRPTPPPVPSPL
jgi:hypothetical protein